MLSASICAHANDLVVGQTAPAITLTTLDGTRIDTANLRGKVVIVTFWATWCEPCREELPLLSRYAADHAAQGLVVLGFSLDTAEAREQVAAIARTLSFPVGFLGDAQRLEGERASLDCGAPRTHRHAVADCSLVR
jgi:peroxiredoxin